MPVRLNQALRAIRAGETVFGGGVVLPHPSVVALYADSGLNFVWLDLEHTLTSPERIGSLVQHARLAGITPIVRVPGFVPGLIRALLDNGTQGIILPFVENPDEVEQLVATCCFHPRGRRGIASPLLANDFTKTSVLDHVTGSDTEILVAIQVESVTGVERVEEIVEVDGLDVVVVGLVDLSISCGFPGEVLHPRVVDAAQHVIDAATASGVTAGVAGFGAPSRGSSLGEWQTRGARFFQLFGDLELLAEAVEREVASISPQAQRTGDTTAR